MDHGILGNVRKIGTFTAIEWTVFKPADNDLAKSGIPSSIVTAIRRDGYHIHLEIGSGQIVLFDLGESFVQSPELQSINDVVDFLHSTGMIQTSQGVLKPVESSDTVQKLFEVNDNGKRKRSLETDELNRANPKAMLQKLSPNVDAVEYRSSVGHAQDALAHSWFSSAVLSSFMAALSHSRRGLPLGLKSFTTTPPREHPCTGLNARDTDAIRSVTSANLLWQMNGTLLLVCDFVQDKQVKFKINEAQDVTLAPFGWLARESHHNIGLGDSSAFVGSKVQIGQAWQSQCRLLLEAQGLQIRTQANWTLLELASGDSTPKLIEWPTCLCVTVNKSKEGPEPILLKYGPHPIQKRLDPLEEAYRWHKESKALMKLIREQQEAKKKELSSRQNTIPFLEDIPPHLYSRYDEPLDAQMLAGIYPTPPEVNRGSSNITSTELVSGTEHVGRSDPVEVENEQLDHLTPSQDASIVLQNFDPMKDDLFDDMDGEIGGENGITEDDFRFFDEPDELETEIVEFSTQDETVDLITELIANEADSQKLHGEEPDTDTEVSIHLPMEEVSISQASPASSPARKVEIDPITVVHTFEQHVDMPVHKEKHQDLDDKYLNSGKFGSIDAPMPNSARPDMNDSSRPQMPILGEALYMSPSSAETPSTDTAQDAALFTLDEESSKHVHDQRQVHSFLVSMASDTTLKTDACLQHDSTILTPQANSVAPAMLEKQGSSFVQLAQIVADQAIFYNRLTNIGKRPSSAIKVRNLENLYEALECSLPKSQPTTLQECVASANAILPMEYEMSNAVTLPTSSVRVRRGEVAMDISFTAVQYWKELGLRPLHDIKNIRAFCLSLEERRHNVHSEEFLQQIKETYEALNLGTHVNGDASMDTDWPKGVLRVPSLDNSDSKTREATWDKFGKALASISDNISTIVIYIIVSNPPKDSFVTLCMYFQSIFESYASRFHKNDKPNDLVLQLVPENLVASGLLGFLPRLEKYSVLSRIVYDRCPLSDLSENAYRSGSSIQLAEPIPASIDFKLTTENVSLPLGAAEAFHVAISHASGSRWYCAAITDVFGSKHWSAAYDLGTYADQSSALRPVAQEILEIVGEASSTRKGYNIFLVKTCPWSEVEINIFKTLAFSSKTPLFMVVYDGKCPLQLKQQSSSLSAESIEHDLLVAPRTPEVSSPDAGGTKQDELESMSRLIDSRNQACWLPCKKIIVITEDSVSLKQFSAGAYLVHDGINVTGVYIQDSTHTTDIAGIVEAFHGLKTLAQGRHVHETMPWHLAVAEASYDAMMNYMTIR